MTIQVDKVDFREFTVENKMHNVARPRLLPGEYYLAVASLERGEHFVVQSKDFPELEPKRIAKVLQAAGNNLDYAIRTRQREGEVHIFRVA